ncbi:TetR/AcrR family transcriptional regulator [Streptomyces sp. NRRL S-340]|uniref:TetR/AcrR family transcriptional regulator n=1 Tax=Streptomyces sp. NRRL S-340 TaxID=1463901 RepID=UPI00068D1BC9|nr:TetR/AcrR family transcriptional regulator [Streptomyces sp. NRRL S-340]
MRESAAAATREAILDTAEALFAEHGYPHVTIKRIADQAGVATGTVYAAFGTKPALVSALTERAADDPGIGEVLAAVQSATTGQEVVRLVVRQTCDLVRHHHRVMAVLFDAAAVDQDIAALLRETEDLQRARFGEVAELLGRLGALRPGVTGREAVRILEYFVAPPSWHRMLRIGWDWEDAHTFLSDAVCAALLR